MTLPIEAVLPELARALASHSSVVLQAPPGAGKTTRVPLALLDAPWLQGRSIVVLEPRRLAARAAAQRMAQMRNEAVGETVGYRIRFESKTSKATRIEVLTEGILTRRLQHDPGLDGVGLVIFDEFHERHLHADLALALCVDSQRGLREDLKLLVMSATLDGAAVSRLLNNAPIISSEGRSFPVEVRHLPRDPEGRLPVTVAAAVQRALEEQEGDALVFLPGAAEIRRTQELLAGGLAESIDVLPLYVGERARYWLAICAIAVSLAFCLLMTVLTFQFWLEAWEGRWVSDTMWRARLWIPYGAMPVGLGILTLQYVADLLNLLTGREPPFGIEVRERAVDASLPDSGTDVNIPGVGI